MAKVTFIQPNGNEQVVETPAGATLMRVAKENGVPGIIADCGGECACSTCHLYIDEAWMDKLPPAKDNESIMFGFLDEPKPTSRLSCQVRMTPEMDGIRLHIPSSQMEP